MASLNKAARNERRKLTATWLNGFSLASGAVGGIGPLVGLTTGTLSQSLRVQILILGLAWLSVSLLLHFAGRAVLRRIEE